MGTVINRAALSWVYGRRARGEIKRCTADNYRLALTRFGEVCGDKPVARIDRRDVERFIASQRHLRPGTVNLNLVAVRVWLDHLVDRGILRSNPARGVRGPKQPKGCPRPYTDDQMRRLFDACHSTRDRLLIELAVQLGLRCGEIAKLEVGDVDLVSKLVTVRHGKGGKTSVLPLTQAAEAAIVAYLDEVGVGNGPLLRSARHPWQPMTRQWVSARFRRIAYESGVKVAGRDGRDLHACRHTFATAVYRQSRDAFVLRDALRHSSLRTSEVYTQSPGMDELRRGMEGRRYGRSCEP